MLILNSNQSIGSLNYLGHRKKGGSASPERGGKLRTEAE
jgi:hypothetical protein